MFVPPSLLEDVLSTEGCHVYWRKLYPMLVVYFSYHWQRWQPPIEIYCDENEQRGDRRNLTFIPFLQSLPKRSDTGQYPICPLFIFSSGGRPMRCAALESSVTSSECSILPEGFSNYRLKSKGVIRDTTLVRFFILLLHWTQIECRFTKSSLDERQFHFSSKFKFLFVRSTVFVLSTSIIRFHKNINKTYHISDLSEMWFILCKP